MWAADGRAHVRERTAVSQPQETHIEYLCVNHAAGEKLISNKWPLMINTSNPSAIIYCDQRFTHSSGYRGEFFALTHTHTHTKARKRNTL